MKDTRTFGQRWADRITEFSGSWLFIGCFTVACLLWIAFNVLSHLPFDPYPFLFLNWILTVVSTFQNPLIMLSQNRQNDMDRDRQIKQNEADQERQVEMMQMMIKMQASLNLVKFNKIKKFGFRSHNKFINKSLMIKLNENQ